MPADYLRAFAAMLPRLQAEESLRAAQVAFLPHYSGTKADKNLGQRIRSGIMDGWRRIALGVTSSTTHGVDAQGRTILLGSGAVREWLGAAAH